ncbi:MAG: hypothetical protein V1682_07405 [Candidatus Omnitrophota bacterium]
MDNLKLPAILSARLEEFTKRIADAYGGSLVSIVLYGSASSGEFAENSSNLNVMVVLDDTSLASLSKACRIVNAPRFAMISPVFFTEDHIASSLDVFPIEFLDIIENHKVLYGKDTVTHLRVDDKNLRFQCEQELKSKLINIKKLYLKTRNKGELESLLFSSFTSALHIMRNLLRLKGRRAPYPKEDILSECEKAFGTDTTVLNKIRWAKNKKMALTRRDIDTLLAGLVKDLEELSSATDRL